MIGMDDESEAGNLVLSAFLLLMITIYSNTWLIILIENTELAVNFTDRSFLFGYANECLCGFQIMITSLSVVVKAGNMLFILFLLTYIHPNWLIANNSSLFLLVYSIPSTPSPKDNDYLRFHSNKISEI